MNYPLASGMNFSMPAPFFCGKLNSICLECFSKRSNNSFGGVPSMLLILCSWSISSLPGNKANLPSS